MMNRVLAFGEILWDVIDGKPHLGGAPLNFAAHCVKCGLPAGMLAAVGQDELGQAALQRMKAVGLDTVGVLELEEPTGTVIVTLAAGQPSYKFSANTANDALSADLLDHDYIDQFDVFYFGTLAQRSDMTREALLSVLNGHSFDMVFFDVNLRENFYSADLIRESLTHCTVWKVNDEEVDVLAPLLFGQDLSFESFCDTACAEYPNIEIVIITAGADGCYVYSNNHLSFVSAQPVQVADTVGAGDSFSAGFISTYLKTQDPVKSAEIANKIGGYVASQTGAIPDYSPQILELIRSL